MTDLRCTLAPQVYPLVATPVRRLCTKVCDSDRRSARSLSCVVHFRHNSGCWLPRAVPSLYSPWRLLSGRSMYPFCGHRGTRLAPCALPLPSSSRIGCAYGIRAVSYHLEGFYTSAKSPRGGGGLQRGVVGKMPGGDVGGGGGGKECSPWEGGSRAPPNSWLRGRGVIDHIAPAPSAEKTNSCMWQPRQPHWPTPVAVRRMPSCVTTRIPLRRLHLCWFRFAHTRAWVWGR